MSHTLHTLLFVSGCAAIAAAPAALAGACDRTTEVAGFACQNEAKDDYWITLGGCANIANNGARGQCVRDAEAQLEEAQDECGAQGAARAQLCAALGQAPYDPAIRAQDFLSPDQAAQQPNPYLPLVPGSRRVYRNAEEIITVTVTRETLEVMGVETTVVRDVVTDLDGELIEDTEDWFAQDVRGNVWYFGEISQNFEDGRLAELEGSWTAGVDLAKPGIVMPAAAVAGRTYRQEFAVGDAEDAARVIDVQGTESTPAASCAGTCVVTADFTPLEPDAIEFKYYAPGVGMILEVDPESGERTELVELR